MVAAAVIVEIVLVIEIAMVLPGLLLRTLSQSFEGRERGERENTGGNWRAHGTTATPFTAATATNAWTVARRRARDMIVSEYCKGTLRSKTSSVWGIREGRQGERETRMTGVPDFFVPE